MAQTNLFQCRSRYAHQPWVLRSQCKNEFKSLNTIHKDAKIASYSNEKKYHLSILFKKYVTHVIFKEWYRYKNQENLHDDQPNDGNENERMSSCPPFQQKMTSFGRSSHPDDTWKSMEVGHDELYTHQYFELIQENLLNGDVIDDNMTWKDKMTLYQWINDLHHSYFYDHAMNHFYVNSLGSLLIIMIVSIFHDICNTFSIVEDKQMSMGDHSTGTKMEKMNGVNNKRTIKNKDSLNNYNRNIDRSINIPMKKSNNLKASANALKSHSQSFLSNSIESTMSTSVDETATMTIDYISENDIGLWNISSYYVYLALPNFFLTWYSIWDIALYLGTLLVVYTALVFYRASKRSIKINSF